MIGKKNVVFGFLYLVLTASLGPYMLKVQYPDYVAASGEKQMLAARLAQIKADGFEENLEALTAEQLAQINSEVLLAMNKADNARAPIEGIKGGPHAHGNLEALLNVAVGLSLLFIGVAPLFKQLISWIFILGTLLHSGLLYLASFDVAWARPVLELGLGPILILVGLLLVGIVAWIGLRPETVPD